MDINIVKTLGGAVPCARTTESCCVAVHVRLFCVWVGHRLLKLEASYRRIARLPALTAHNARRYYVLLLLL